jgi:CBS domain containing-hemolysin-like protein
VSDAWAIGLAVLLLAGNAFFVGAEFALVSARRSALEPRAEDGSPRARTTLAAMEQVSLMMAASQLGITVFSVALGAVAEPAVAHQLERLLELVHAPGWLADPLAFAVALVIVVGFHMVLGEMVPKNLAIAGPERAALLLGPPMFRLVRALRPVIVGLNAVSNALVRLARTEPKDEVASAFTPEEVVAMVEESGEEGLLAAEDARLLRRAVRFTERTARDVMVPRDEVRTLPDSVTVGGLEGAVQETGYSRFPVTGGDGRVRGFVHAKDLLLLDDVDPDETFPAERIRDLPEVPARATLDEVVRRMQRSDAHQAQIVEDGELLGLVMLEDALEALIGVVRDRTHAGA